MLVCLKFTRSQEEQRIMRCFHFDLTLYRLTAKLIEERMLFFQYQTLCSTKTCSLQNGRKIQIY